MYKRKTRDAWQLWIDYGQGWEHELTEYSFTEYRSRVKEYRKNCPQFPIKCVFKREPLEG